MSRLALLALACGCMKIYPDPELPDILVLWTSTDCHPQAPDVALTLTNMDTGESDRVVVPCTDVEVRFEDIDRARYRIDGVLLLDDGSSWSEYWNELDLRNGLDGEVYMFFGGGGSFRVDWTFDMGATCESLGSEFVRIEVEDPDGSPYQFFHPCSQGPLISTFEGVDMTLRIRALDVGLNREATLGISPVIGPFSVQPPAITNLGTVTITPCAPSCP